MKHTPLTLSFSLLFSKEVNMKCYIGSDRVLHIEVTTKTECYAVENWALDNDIVDEVSVDEPKSSGILVPDGHIVMGGK